MIVQDIMTTKLVTVTSDDTLAHAANLFRQYRFHHLPVARSVTLSVSQEGKDVKKKLQLLEGILTAQDINTAAAVSAEGGSANLRPWQERLVVEVMHRALLRVTPTTSVSAAAQMLVERGLDYLPVVEYRQIGDESKTVLVGLLTRSDLLVALARAMGAFEPGMQMDVELPLGDMLPLAETIRIAGELHMKIRSVLATPGEDGILHVASLRLGTINPTPLLVRLRAAGIQFSFGVPSTEGGSHV